MTSSVPHPVAPVAATDDDAADAEDEDEENRIRHRPRGRPHSCGKTKHHRSMLQSDRPPLLVRS